MSTYGVQPYVIEKKISEKLQKKQKLFINYNSLIVLVLLIADFSQETRFFENKILESLKKIS